MKAKRRAKRVTRSKAGGAARGPKKKAKSARSKRAAAVPTASASSQDAELQAAVLRRLLEHLDERKDVQNIELMILAGFCRNCLSRWWVEAALERGVELDVEGARKKVYGMPYDEWKSRHQPPATEDQLRRFEQAQRRGG